ncbi:MAG: ABC transporter substrate-binding protein [Bryobacteraceae bacterium]|jgi:peptide/nickel transport system substrate-binding protein
MRLHAWAWLALSSLLLVPLAGSTRPRYGGNLTVELSSAWTSIESSGGIAPLIAETLVRLNDKGEIEPLLATAWQRDPDRKRWRFSLRPKVLFHDGEQLNASTAAPSLAAALKKKYGDVNITAGGQTLVFQFDRAIPDLLTELSSPRMAIFRSSEKAALIGTGPFRVTAWEPGHKLALAAFEDYWAGRPFLDSVTINLGTTRDTGDVFDIPFAQSRRVLPERIRIWSARVRELIALVSESVQPEVFEALSLAIDRVPIVNVLAQRRGEAAFSLLPQWLSGYAFLFAAPGKQMVSQQRTGPLTLSYPANDAFERSIAERVALNARDAGIILQPTQNPARNPAGAVRMVRWPLESIDAAAELSRIATMLGMPDRANALNSSNPETLYEAERALLGAHRVIPIIYLPEVYGIAPRVHNWEAAQRNGGGFALHLDNIWVDP